MGTNTFRQILRAARQTRNREGLAERYTWLKERKREVFLGLWWNNCLEEGQWVERNTGGFYWRVTQGISAKSAAGGTSLCTPTLEQPGITPWIHHLRGSKQESITPQKRKKTIPGVGGLPLHLSQFDVDNIGHNI